MMIDCSQFSFFSVRLSRLSALRYGLPSCISVKTTKRAVFSLAPPRHRRNTFCDVTAPGQRYLSLFDRMKEIASFAASPLARVYETLRPCLLWNFTSSLRLSETSFL